MRCNHHDLELYSDQELLEHMLNDHLTGMEALMTEMSDDQKHLDDAVDQLKASFAAEVAALKAQVAAQPTVMAAHLDFSKLDGLVGETTAAANIQPTLIPADDPSLASTNANPTQIGATEKSPFVDTDGDAVDGKDTDGDPDEGPVVPAEQGSEATATPATDAQSVVAPENDITPSTENPPTTSA